MRRGERYKPGEKEILERLNSELGSFEEILLSERGWAVDAVRAGASGIEKSMYQIAGGGPHPVTAPAPNYDEDTDMEHDLMERAEEIRSGDSE